MTDLATFYAYPLTERAYVRASLVQTSDGSLTGPDHRSHSITRPADQRALATMRHLADVILIGGNTVRREDFGRTPPADGTEMAPVDPATPVAVVSRSLDLDPTSSLFDPDSGRTFIFTGQVSSPDRRRVFDQVANLIVADSQNVEMAWLLDQLAARSLRHVHCEAGPDILDQLIAADLLDELCLTTVPELATWDAPRWSTPSSFRLAATRVEDGLTFERFQFRGPLQ